MSNLFSIVIMHAGGQRKVVSVEYVCERYLTFRWSQSGTYILTLEDNTIRSTSVKARRKGNMDSWTAEDINAVRKMVTRYLNPGKEETLKESLAKHQESMPPPGRIGLWGKYD